MGVAWMGERPQALRPLQEPAWGYPPSEGTEEQELGSGERPRGEKGGGLAARVRGWEGQ